MEIIYIILGWLFGILSPGIIDKIAKSRKKEGLRRMFIHDLKDIKGRLVLIPFQVYSGYGNLDEETFNWVKEQTNDFEEIDSDKDVQKHIKDLKEKVRLDWNRFKDYMNKTSEKNNPAWNFQKMHTNIIDSNIMHFELLEDDFLTKVLEIKFQINIFNEEVQNVNEYLKMTFDSSISEVNMEIIKKEIERKNYLISDKARRLVGKINQLISVKKI